LAKGKAPVNPVLGVGPRDAYGICVAESPGKEEAYQGTPLVGPTGQQFDDELLKSGLLRSKLFLVNAICCKPPDHKSEPEMHKAVTACAPAFWAQVNRYPRDIPKFLMGKWAIYQVLGKNLPGGIEKGRGFLRPEPYRSIEDAMEVIHAGVSKKPI
jgi:uracil-DNA glycosylase